MSVDSFFPTSHVWKNMYIEQNNPPNGGIFFYCWFLKSQFFSVLSKNLNILILSAEYYSKFVAAVP